MRTNQGRESTPIWNREPVELTKNAGLKIIKSHGIFSGYFIRITSRSGQQSLPTRHLRNQNALSFLVARSTRLAGTFYSTRIGPAPIIFIFLSFQEDELLYNRLDLF